jgi:hypothetical protein
MYCMHYCFICRTSDYTVSEIEPRTDENEPMPLLISGRWEVIAKQQKLVLK